MVWKGFTSGEFLLAVPFIGWLTFTYCMLLMPLAVVFFGGGWIAGYKRGKPENYIWQRLEEIRCRARLSRALVADSRAWEIRRARAIRPGGRS